MKENEIRPQDIRKTYAEKQKQDIRKYFFSNTGKINFEKMVNIKCPACSGIDSEFIFEKASFRFHKCKCETLFVNPRPEKEALLEYVSKGDANSFYLTDILEKTRAIRKKNIFAPRADILIDLLNKYKIKTPLLLDAGGGNGLFIEELIKRKIKFKKLLNIDPSHEACELCKKRKVDFHEGMFEDLAGYDNKVDIIVGFELIGHLFSPKEFINKCNKVLKKDGLLYLTMSNITGFDLLLLGKYSDNIGAPDILNYFSIDSISILLRQNGFKILDIKTSGELDLNIVESKYRQYPDLNIDKFTKTIIESDEKVKVSFQEFLKSNNLSSSMYVIAKNNLRN